MRTTPLPQSHHQSDERRGWRLCTVDHQAEAAGGECHVSALYFLLLLVFSAPLGDASHVPSPNAKINGMQLLNGQWGQAKYDSTEALATLESLTNQTGASWISMTFW